MFDHAGQLHDPLQLQLAPPAADLRGAQRGDQLPGLALQLLGGAMHRADLLAQTRIGGFPLLLHRAQLTIEPVQALRDRAQQRLDGLLTLGGVAV